MSAVVALLRQRLAELDAPALVTPGLPTGIDALDAALSSRGIPRGRLTEITGSRGAGKTSLVRQLVAHTVAERGWVAVIDATRTLAPRDWAPLGARDGEGFWIIRPPARARAAWCADVLLRSGAFALVVLDGAPPLRRSVATRLVRLARESDAALVVTTGDEAMDTALLASAVRLRVETARHRRRSGGTTRQRGTLVLAVAEPAPDGAEHRLAITVEKGGGRHTVEVGYAVRMARRLCTHSEVPDRRGVGGRGRARSAEAGGPPSVRTLPRKRRCAESDFGRSRSGCG